MYFDEKGLNELDEEQRVLREDFCIFFTEVKKTVRPDFMKTLFDKGETNKNFDYKYFNTPMCWIKNIVLEIPTKDKDPYGSAKNLVDLMVKRTLKSGEYNKIIKILRLAETYYKEYDAANNKGDWGKANTIKDSFIMELKKYRGMSGSTVYAIIKKCYKKNRKTDKKPEYRHFLLKCLCKHCKSDVYACFKEIKPRKKIR